MTENEPQNIQPIAQPENVAFLTPAGAPFVKSNSRVKVDIKFLLLLAFAAGGLVVLIKTIPSLTGTVGDHEKRLTVIETRMVDLPDTIANKVIEKLRRR